MADNEIIKALECCGKNPPICIECSYKGKCNRKDCYDYLKDDALSLINRQKAEIERLQNEIRFLHANDMTIAEKVKEQSKGRERGVKEFYEGLKEYVSITVLGIPVVALTDIDNLKKEMVGE